MREARGAKTEARHKLGNWEITVTQVRHNQMRSNGQVRRICRDFLTDQIKVVRETEALRLRSMHFYSSNLRTEVMLTDMEKHIREAHLEKDLELGFGNVKVSRSY